MTKPYIHPTETHESQNENLRDAARDGDLTALKIALKKGADVNSFYSGDKLRLFPLVLAAYNGQIDCVKHLLTVKGININQTESIGNTALISATVLNKADCVKILIDANADIECVNSNDQTAVTQATIFDCMETIEVLINAGANTDKLSNQYKEKCADLINAQKAKEKALIDAIKKHKEDKKKHALHHRNVSTIQKSLKNKQPQKPKRRSAPKR